MRARGFGRSGDRARAFASKELAIASAKDSEGTHEGGRYDGPSQTSVATRIFDLVPFNDAADADPIYWSKTFGPESSRLAGDGSDGGDLRAMVALSGSARSDGGVPFQPGRSVATWDVCLDRFSSFAVF